MQTRQTTYGYDLDGRQTLVDSPEGILHYEYSAANGRLTRTWSEDLSTTANLTDAMSDVRYSYDLFGRLWTVQQFAQAGAEFQTPPPTVYGYDAAGNLRGVSLPTGNNSPRVTTYKYDAMERLSEILNETPAIKDNFGSPAVTHFKQVYTRSAAGQITHIEEQALRDTAAIDYVYDNLGRLTEEHCTGPRPLPQYSHEIEYDDSYIYDLVGNRLRKTHHRMDDTNVISPQVVDEIVEYAYDERDRLLTETVTLASPAANPMPAPSNRHRYEYDANGAQTLKAFEAYSGGSFVATAATAEHYRFDLRGRLARVENVFGHLTGTVSGGNGVDDRLTVNYHYDHHNARVRSEQSALSQHNAVFNSQTMWLVDHRNPTGYSQTLEQRVKLGIGSPGIVHREDTPEHTYTWGHGLISQNGLPVVADHQGTVRQIGPAGSVPDQYSFDAFGVPTDALALNLLGQLAEHHRTWPTEYRYTGEPIDVGIGLQFNRQRWLNVNTASFVSADPLGHAALGATLYTYTSNDPANGTDPSGLWTQYDSLNFIVMTDLTTIGKNLLTLVDFMKQSFASFFASSAVGTMATPGAVTPTVQDIAALAHYKALVANLIQVGDQYWMGGHRLVEQSAKSSLSLCPNVLVSGTGSDGTLKVSTAEGDYQFPARWPELRQGLYTGLTYLSVGFANGGVRLVTAENHNVPYWPGISIKVDNFRPAGNASPASKAESAIDLIGHEAMHDFGFGAYGLGAHSIVPQWGYPPVGTDLENDHIYHVFSGVSNTENQNDIAWHQFVVFLQKLYVCGSGSPISMWDHLNTISAKSLP